MKESGAGMSRDNDEESDDAPDELVRIAEETKEKWDCESILSEYHDLKTLTGVMFKINNYTKVHHRALQS